MATASTRIHMICGFCGCNDEFEFTINPKGNCNNEGIEYPAVFIVCNNCSSLTGLDEVIKEVLREKPEEKG